MAKKAKLTEEEAVNEYVMSLNHPLKEVVMELRDIISTAGDEIKEQIKWNSLSYYYSGEMKPFDPKEFKRDIVVLNLHKEDFVLMVFPTGAIIQNDYEILEGNYPDSRKSIKISSKKELKEKSLNLQNVIKEWLKLVDK